MQFNLIFNYGDATNAFVKDERIRDCSDASNPCRSPYSGYSTTIGIRPKANSPFAGPPPPVTFATQGTTRVRIERTGILGEKFRIQMDRFNGRHRCRNC